MGCLVKRHARIGNDIIDPSEGTFHSVGGFEVHGEMIVFSSVISIAAPHFFINSMVKPECRRLTEIPFL